MTGIAHSGQIDAFFDRLTGIDGPVLQDLRDPDTPREVTGRALPDLLDRVAGWLAARDVGPGDRVVAVFDNRLDAALLLLAAMRHGVTLCLQPAGTEDAELRALRKSLGAAAVIATPEDAAPVAERFDLAQAQAARSVPAPAVALATPLTITFTSGSTGAPKGIVHAARSFLDCAEAFNRQTGIGAGDRFLNVMPMFYMAGIFNGVLAPLAAGAQVVIDRAFDARTAMGLWPAIAARGVTALWLSPTMLALAVRLDRRADRRAPAGLRRLFVGTGAMARADAEAFARDYGLPPLQSYGLSEILYVSVDDADAPAFGSVGRPLEGVQVMGGGAAPLAFSSPYSFLGYLQEGRLIAQDGAFQTTDLGHLSPFGVLTIEGRADDVILRGGVNVNPAALENQIAPLMGDRAFCIAGLPDRGGLGQKVALVVEGAALDDATLSRLRAHVRDLPGQLRIDATASVPALPRGPTGKVRRANLSALLAEGPEL